MLRIVVSPLFELDVKVSPVSTSVRGEPLGEPAPGTSGLRGEPKKIGDPYLGPKGLYGADTAC